MRSLSEWLWRRPLLIVLLAHTVFSIGIWNARNGYAEDTVSVQAAFRVLQSGRPCPSLYSNLIALTLRWVTRDVVTALTLMKYLSSLLATVALYLALSSFSGSLRQSAIVFACLLWIASSLDAPYLQSTSQGLFTFAIMAFGIDCLLAGESIPRLAGFYFFGVLAALMRPEYYVALALMTLGLAGWAIWRGSTAMKQRYGWPRPLTGIGLAGLALALAAALLANLPVPVLNTARRLNNHYALLGFGQCYADFYRGEHPNEVFDPMTEYRQILDRTFNKPSGFCAATRNNPLEALRYFAINGARNLLWYGPCAVIARYREQSARHRHGVLFWAVRGVLLLSGIEGATRVWRSGWTRADFSGALSSVPTGRGAALRKVSLLVLLLVPSFVAVVMLIGLSRYYLCWVPLVYLGVAYGADALLQALSLVPFERSLTLLSFILLCAPNYLTPRFNYEFDGVRQAASHAKEHPVVAASWADPDAVIALGQHATALNVEDGIRQTDIANGQIDILVIDSGFRRSRTWAEQRDFFENFERRPDSYGFKKAGGIPTGNPDVYYKPAAASPVEKSFRE